MLVHRIENVLDHGLSLLFKLLVQYFFEFPRYHPSDVQAIDGCPYAPSVAVRFYLDVIEMIESDDFVVDYCSCVSSRILSGLKRLLVHYGRAHGLKASSLPVIPWIVRAYNGPPRVKKWHVDLGDQGWTGGSLLYGSRGTDARSINDAY